ncbi:MAG: class D sortase [Anaerolineales bacterium]|nr:class D sortase [Anaerolineales bacterium]
MLGIIRLAMPRRKSPEDLSVEELRRLLIEKRRGARRERIEHFRRTGRVVAVPPEEPEQIIVKEDELREAQAFYEEPPKAPPPRRLGDKFLLGVEVLAVVGLIGVILGGLGILRDLNDQVAAALAPGTAQPTPLVTAVILPSGHTPPDEQGNTRPNDAEIPEHLRPMVQSLSNIAVPTAGPEQAIRIQIPALKVDAPIVQGDGWEQLKKGVGQHIGSGNPGQDGNVVLSAHNDVYGQLFRNLDKLVPGDQVILYTQLRQYVYVVTGTIIVEPTKVDIMMPTADPTITLISCYPYLVNKQRIVVFAKLQN